jgi:hypothetical protein
MFWHARTGTSQCSTIVYCDHISAKCAHKCRVSIVHLYIVVQLLLHGLVVSLYAYSNISFLHAFDAMAIRWLCSALFFFAMSLSVFTHGGFTDFISVAGACVMLVILLIRFVIVCSCLVCGHRLFLLTLVCQLTTSQFC